MTAPHDEWDDEERGLLEGLRDDLEGIRRRHAGDPPLDVLAAASEEALPPEWQADVQQHLDASPWSRALLEGATLPEEPLDAVTDARMLARIRQGTGRGAPPSGRWGLRLMFGGTLAASALLAALLWPRPAAVVPATGDMGAASGTDAATATPRPADTAPPAPAVSAEPRAPTGPPAPPPPMSLRHPEVRLQMSSLTWRGAPDSDTYLQDLVPAMTAYRAGDFRTAAEAFLELMPRYPDAFEVHFYGGYAQWLGDVRRSTALATLDAAIMRADDDVKGEAMWVAAAIAQRSGRAAQEPAAFRARLDALCALGGPWGARGCAQAAAWRAHDDAVAAWQSDRSAPSVPAGAAVPE